ncbi:MAG: SDR family oxidoreductase [Parvibaculum sp.]|uniref:SDR family oxidoreductase n=1 Tax=Parvibaculum sp. TaxID=2024848 RepID=UPI0025F9B216|nr:SDR family NAD(P)-dependent oxidoreductase [Parvibaculum sp.]MCE9651097.1 SDR family oxidoreductase [Parvibaculum sp.]
MTNFIKDKVIVITGAGGGFGRLIAQKAGALGGKIVCADIDEAGLIETVKSVSAKGGIASHGVASVAELGEMQALAAHAVERHGAIDVMVNNAGIMPLAFFADHKAAASAWSRCIDVNIKGVVNGISCVFDQMMGQGRGHVVNISSICGNFPVVGAGVYGATKAAVNFLSESLRVEAQGKIKVTIVKPTGVPGTGLGTGIINADAIVGILGQNAASYGGVMASLAAGNNAPELRDPDNPQYAALEPGYIADAVITAINQPWGVSLGDITVRATGDGYIL